MHKNILILTLVIVVITIALAAIITNFIFNTSFAHNTIDYFSFAIALFLVVDGIYKIIHYRDEKYFPNHFVRHLRIITGTCIFTIHVLQYVYGI